jgi:hypothetical protein
LAGPPIKLAVHRFAVRFAVGCLPTYGAQDAVQGHASAFRSPTPAVSVFLISGAGDLAATVVAPLHGGFRDKP